VRPRCSVTVAAIAAADVSLSDRLQRRELKILVIDIERLPGQATVPFWSLSGYKHRRIHHKYVVEWPRTICAAWRWYGNKRIDFAAEWDAGGPAAFAEKIRDLLDDADIITGHNVNGFDRKHLNSLFRDHGLRMPSPYKVIDTLTIARRELGDESLTLDALCSRYGIPTKEGHYDADIARDACAGIKRAQRNIKLYNCADVEASTGLYTVMLPLAKGHPHVAPNAASDQILCPRCGSEDVHRNGTYSPAVFIYKRYLCDTCTGWFRTTYETRGPSVLVL
jgi:hypothetical protein